MKTFEEMGLNEKILKAVNELGFEAPTPIQEKAIPQVLSSKQDLIALAQTGTGKTAAFGLPVINQIDVSNKKVQVIVLCPTRELCIQITRDFNSFTKYIDGLRVTAVYGGASIENQIRDLKKGSQMVVGTPGRVIDMIERGKLKISEIRWLVLDEADEMLNMGFKEDIDTILETTPDDRQTLLFSATMPREIVSIAENYMNKPNEITVGKRNSGAENVEHSYYMVAAKNRYLALKRLADVNPDIFGIIFCRTRRETQEVADKLINDGYNADSLHGDLSQGQRDIVMGHFRKRHLQLLVATDVAARGLDVSDVTHVINYNLPDEDEVYVHRSGRTGRAGKKGGSIAIIHSKEMYRVKRIEKKIGKKFTAKKVPTGQEICEKQLYKLIDKVKDIKVEEEQIEKFLPIISKKLEELSREELIKKFISVEFNSFLNYYKGEPDINLKEQKDRGERSGRGSRDGFSKFYINLGEKDRLTKLNLIGIINDLPGADRPEIGKIEVLEKFSFFEVESSSENFILEKLNETYFKKRKVVVELKTGAEPDRNRRRRSSGRNRRRR